MQRLKVFIFVFLFFTLFCKGIDTFAINTKTSQLPYSSGETLHYKLSYRGIFTSMIWADLADIQMSYIDDQKTPDKQNACQFELYLTTENYTKAEMFQPVRYTYKTILNKALQRTVLVEETDIGNEQSHEFLWLDWKNKETQLFKKREKIQESTGFYGSGFLGIDFLETDVKEVWEKGDNYNIPDFLKHFPLLADQQTYIIHKESGDKIKYSQILDPLSLIYILRTLDFTFAVNTTKEIPVAVSDDIRIYRIQKQSLETFSLNGKKVQGTKFKIQTNEKKDNYYYLWLSHDQYKIPLRMAMDAPLGKLEIDLVKITQ